MFVYNIFKSEETVIRHKTFVKCNKIYKNKIVLNFKITNFNKFELKKPIFEGFDLKNENRKLAAPRTKSEKQQFQYFTKNEKSKGGVVFCDKFTKTVKNFKGDVIVRENFRNK